MVKKGKLQYIDYCYQESDSDDSDDYEDSDGIYDGYVKKADKKRLMIARPQEGVQTSKSYMAILQ